MDVTRYLFPGPWSVSSMGLGALSSTDLPPRLGILGQEGYRPRI